MLVVKLITILPLDKGQNRQIRGAIIYKYGQLVGRDILVLVVSSQMLPRLYEAILSRKLQVTAFCLAKSALKGSVVKVVAKTDAFDVCKQGHKFDWERHVYPTLETPSRSHKESKMVILESLAV